MLSRSRQFYPFCYTERSMEHPGAYHEEPKFSSPEEELRYLRERVAKQEQHNWNEGVPGNREAIISHELLAYGKSSPEERLEEHLIVENPQFESAVEYLSSLSHREKVRELYRVLAEKGILNAIRLAQSQNNPHIEADFHHVLVGYVRTGALIPGLDKEEEVKRALHMTVYEVTLPFAVAKDGIPHASFSEVISAMEHFFIGMIPTEGASVLAHGPFALELVLSNFSSDIVFYVSVEDRMKDLFVKQILGAFPSAKIEEETKDHNIFNEFGVTTASVGSPLTKFAYPIQYADEVANDPIMVMLNSFTHVARDGEGVAIQFLVYPDADHLQNKLKYASGQMRQGVPVSRATDIPLSTGGAIVKTFSEFFSTQIKTEKKPEKPDAKDEEESQRAIALIDEKIKSPILRANVRIVVSTATAERSDLIRTSLESSFNQFNRPHGGGIKFNRVAGGDLRGLLHQFTYRIPDDRSALVLNTKELATLYHFPVAVSQKEAPQLKTVKSASAPAPADLPSEGILIGVNNYRGARRDVRLTKADRLRHLYTLGQTGAGKSVFLKNLAVQDILAGNGVCFIDPHGSDVQDVLSAVPKERIEDVIYFEPTFMERPFALNMLEYDPSHPEQKIFVVNEMFAIFKKLYAASNPESMGPAFEQYFRNATMLVLEDPETGCTLLEIPRVLADPEFRNLKLSRCKNPIVVQFWRDIATKTSGETGLQNMIPYITNKFDVFIANDVMRPIIAQEKSSFNFREIMDKKKILLVNLSKGKLGELNANLLGLIIIGKFLMAAMSRVDSFGGPPLPDFYLYVDEFQNVATPSISAILSEARKYGLSLNLAHQYIDQLPEDIKSAVFGNVGNMVLFRVGSADAEFLQPQLAPIFTAGDIMKQENRNAYAKILINGKPVPPFNMEMLPPPTGKPEIVEKLKQLSFLKYGRDYTSVNEEIMKRYLKPKPSPVAPSSISSSMGQGGTPTLRPTPLSQPPPTVSPVPVAPPLPTAPPAGNPISSVKFAPPQNEPAQLQAFDSKSNPIPPTRRPFADAFSRIGKDDKGTPDA